MNKEKTQSLTKYLNDLINRLQSPTPEKHIHSPATYKQFLNREIETIKNKLEAARLEGTAK